MTYHFTVLIGLTENATDKQKKPALTRGQRLTHRHCFCDWPWPSMKDEPAVVDVTVLQEVVLEKASSS